MIRLCSALCLLLLPLAARADESYARVVQDVNQKMVKLFGSGGFRGLVHYGTGVVVSPDGYVLTVASHMLDTADLRVHLYDGRRYHAKVVVTEPELDLALVKIELGQDEEIPCFDLAEAAKRPLAAPGTAILAFSNQFEIATRDEPMSVQRGIISAYAKLLGRRGVFEAPYQGDVYFVDAISNNPGAGGGALVTRKGELLGIVGKELRNALSDTWVNYAVPVQAAVEVKTAEGKVETVRVLDLVEKKEEYRPVAREKPKDGGGGYHGIVLVPDVVERTPPYIEAVAQGSPADRAGLKPDDLIVYVDGEQVSYIKAFEEIMNRLRPGTAVKLEVRRGERLTGVELKLEEPPKAAAAKP